MQGAKKKLDGTKVLWNPQISNKKTAADSNVIFFRALAENTPEIHYYFHSRFSHSMGLDNVTVISRKNSVHQENPWEQRVNWNHQAMHELFKRTEPDVIFENNPTLVHNWYMLFDTFGIMPVPIISYNNWIDSKQYPKTPSCNSSIALRQVEGARLSDIALVNSFEAASQLRKSASDYNVDLNNVDILTPAVEKPRNYHNLHKNDVNYFRILYNHRVGTPSFYVDAYRNFCDAINLIHDTYPEDMRNVVITFTDPNNKIPDPSSIPIFNTYREILRCDRKQYESLLFQSHLCVAAFNRYNGGTWSMSIADAILARCPVITSSGSGYAEMFPNDYKFKVDPANVNKLADMIHDLIKNAPDRALANDTAYQYYIKNFSTSKIVEKYKGYILEVLIRRKNASLHI